MTDKEGRKLATRIAKESDGVSVKFGRTNGRFALHLIRRQGKTTPAASTTIFTEPDWVDHPWNRDNAKKANPFSEIDYKAVRGDLDKLSPLGAEAMSILRAGR